MSPQSIGFGFRELARFDLGWADFWREAAAAFRAGIARLRAVPSFSGSNVSSELSHIVEYDGGEKSADIERGIRATAAESTRSWLRVTRELSDRLIGIDSMVCVALRQSKIKQTKQIINMACMG